MGISFKSSMYNNYANNLFAPKTGKNIQGIEQFKKPENTAKATKTVLEEADPQIEQIKSWTEDQSKSQKLSSIRGKMMTGASLSIDELDYLRNNAPEEYKKAVQLEREREQYEKELKQCRTKEDVEKLRERHLTTFASQTREIASNPNIPADKKRELIEFQYMRMNNFLRVYEKFIGTEEYKALPDESEEDEIPEVNNEKAEAEKAEMEELLEVVGLPAEKTEGNANNVNNINYTETKITAEQNANIESLIDVSV